MVDPGAKKEKVLKADIGASLKDIAKTRNAIRSEPKSRCSIRRGW